MLFCVDVGNSHTVSGIFSGKRLIAQWRLPSNRGETADELAVKYGALFGMAGMDFKEVTGFIVASVVPSLETVWLSFGGKHLAKIQGEPLAVSAALDTGLAVCTDNPAEVGADRIVNGVAARERVQGNLIVIDFGTAITFDCVSMKGEFLGGVIMPGIGICMEALTSRTAKLPVVDISERPEKVIGTSTAGAIRSGILHGYGGMVDKMVEKLSQEMVPANEPVRIIATGGMAELIAPYTTVITLVDPLLTLKGLTIIHERVSSRSR